jgi:hypothetical protein
VEVRLPKKDFKLSEELLNLLEIQGTCFNTTLLENSTVSIPDSVAPKFCRKITDEFPYSCGGGKCTTYKVKSPFGVYILIRRQTKKSNGDIEPKDTAYLTVREQIDRGSNYHYEKIILLESDEFSKYIVE